MRAATVVGYIFSFVTAVSLLAQQPAHRELSSVPFTSVKVQDTFWAPRILTNREKSLPHNFRWCEQTGRFANFAKAAGKMTGKFEGIYFNDSDVYKVLEGASYSLADHPDAQLQGMADRVIAQIAAAQQPDGYLNTYYTLAEPGQRWTNCQVRHEMYCAGHLIEAAVAHFQATGRRTLLDVARRFADHIDSVFGPDKRYDVCGHEEIELALVKLSQATGEQRYMDLAQFFIRSRGDGSKRKLYGPYCQDHLPVRDQSEIVGHAVRAMYLYCGVADVAAHTGEPGYLDAMRRLWADVVERKMYITGGIGARHSGEAFGDAYELPNDSAYCETCASIGLALWSHRLNLLHGDAHYADVLERVVYNGVLAGVGLDGEHFFYVNPLASAGRHHRQPFYPCACCPTNVVRFLPSLPGYVYAQGKTGLFVNLYIASSAEVSIGDTTLRISQATEYPWDGKVRLKLEPKQPCELAVHLRIPDWCTAPRLAVNGQAAEPQITKGYARVHRRWQSGDTIDLDLPMEIRRIEAHPAVQADRGRVALQRGPLVYCLEGVDHGGRVRSIVLPHDPKFAAERRPDLLGGITVLRGSDGKGRELIAVPYYIWDHREPGEMIVWVRQDGKSRSAETADASWANKLYRPLDPRTLGPSMPLPLAERAVLSASHANSPDAVDAVREEGDPKNSCDHDISRFTWWDHRGTQEWVQYEFDAPARVSAVQVYWFDDGRVKRHCRVPKSWRLLYRKGDAWHPVRGASGYGLELDKYNRTTFESVETTGLRIEVELNPPWSGGILRWKVE